MNTTEKYKVNVIIPAESFIDERILFVSRKTNGDEKFNATEADISYKNY
jgi:hypothetical protein